MNQYKCYGIVTGLVLLVLYFGYAIYSKEETLAEGQLVLLKLTPVDPRSLMQGDYMRLRYDIAAKLENNFFGDTTDNLENMRDKLTRKGFLALRLDSNKVAQVVNVYSNTSSQKAGETLIMYKHHRYSITNRRSVTIGAESYFFEEGTGSKYDSAKYAGIRVDSKGNSILVGLFDKNYQLIKP